MDWLAEWIWHGLALVVLVRLAATKVPSTSAATRFAIWWITLAAAVMMPALPLLFAAGETMQALRPATTLIDPEPVGFEISAPPDWLVSIAIGAWLGFVLLSLLGILRAAREIEAMKRRCDRVRPALERLVDRLHGTASRRQVSVHLTDELDAPALLGFRNPIVAIPRRLADRLSTREIELIVRHELAHAERRDDWSRLVQRTLEALFCFHPAIRLIGRRLDDERELACDDQVIAAGVPRKEYAACLTRLAELCAVNRAPALTAGAMGGRSTITARVERLVADRTDAGRRSSLLGAASGMAVVTATLFGLTFVPPVLTIATEPVLFSRADDRRQVPVRVQAPALASIDTIVERHSASLAVVPRVVRRVTPAIARSGGTPDAPRQAEQPPIHVSETLPVHQRRDSERQAEIQAVTALAATMPVETVRAIVTHEPLLARLPEADLPARPQLENRRRLPHGPDDRAIWESVAGAGMAVGDGAKRAGVATGRFFSKVGITIARSF